MKFKAGEPRPPNAGRRAGTPNKRTVEVRSVLEAAAREIGGLERLVAWIKEDRQNERDFWVCMYMKLLPVQVQGSGEHGEIELSVKIPREELARKLEEHGLPAWSTAIRSLLCDLRGENGLLHKSRHKHCLARPDSLRPVAHKIAGPFGIAAAGLPGRLGLLILFALVSHPRVTIRRRSTRHAVAPR
jgi:hypothetical protein